MKRTTTQNLGKVVHTRQASYISKQFAERVCHTKSRLTPKDLLLSQRVISTHSFWLWFDYFFIPPQKEWHRNRFDKLQSTFKISAGKIRS